MCIYIYVYVYVICTWGLTELAIGAQRTAGEGRTVLGRPNPKSEKIRDYNLNPYLRRDLDVTDISLAGETVTATSGSPAGASPTLVRFNSFLS